MGIKTKVMIGLAILVLTTVGYATFSVISEKRDREEATQVADSFTKWLHGPEDDISHAYGLISEGFRALQSKNTVVRMRDVAIGVVGNYLGHSGAKDVTNALAPDAPQNIRLISFDVAYDNDPEGRIIVTMIKERGKWRVHGFNINSPKLTEAEMNQRIVDQTPAAAQNEVEQV